VSGSTEPRHGAPSTDARRGCCCRWGTALRGFEGPLAGLRSCWHGAPASEWPRRRQPPLANPSPWDDDCRPLSRACEGAMVPGNWKSSQNVRTTLPPSRVAGLWPAGNGKPAPRREASPGGPGWPWRG